MKSIFLFIFMPFTFFGFYAHSETINIAVLEYCPFVCDPLENNGNPGFTIELERNIFERAGYHVEFHYVPYIRAIKGTEQGRYDAVGFCNDHSSDVNICSTETIGPMQQTFYVKKGNPWRYLGIESLEQTKLGVIRGYNYNAISEPFQDYIDLNKGNYERVEFKYGDDVLNRILKNIIRGRLGTTNESEYVVDYLAKKKGYYNLLEKAGTFDNAVIWGRICFSPKNPQAEMYVKLIDQGIQQMKANGELEEILKKYQLEYWGK